jgi:hypothetical protein
MDIPQPGRVIGQLVKIWGNKSEWMADNSYVQSQLGKVPRYSFRIQASLLFVVPPSGGTRT